MSTTYRSYLIIGVTASQAGIVEDEITVPEKRFDPWTGDPYTIQTQKPRITFNNESHETTLHDFFEDDIYEDTWVHCEDNEEYIFGKRFSEVNDYKDWGNVFTMKEFEDAKQEASDWLKAHLGYEGPLEIHHILTCS